jgi:hypothetical protein
MLGRMFIALSRLPGLKKPLWRTWYNYLARSHRAPEWTFMNYGYATPGENMLRLAETDEPDRHWIQLYHHVAGAVDLENCRVLEVGSGRGGGASFIKRYLRPASMIGVDLSKDAIDLSANGTGSTGSSFASVTPKICRSMTIRWTPSSTWNLPTAILHSRSLSRRSDVSCNLVDTFYTRTSETGRVSKHGARVFKTPAFPSFVRRTSRAA